MKSFYSVSTVNDKNDNGSCATFATYAEALAYREWALEQGLWFVSAIWS